MFFSRVEDNEQYTERMAHDFLKLVESCINYKESKIWSYDPDWQSQDELYDFIAWGFTYVIVAQDDPHCLFIPGGYMDVLHKELKALGFVIDLEPTDQSWGNREMYIHDPDGNSIRFVHRGG
jgi:catechol 2,3-dioxygenase-like lactoylglutathione lyase family enzyme